VPKKRIIHQRVVRLHGPARLHRLGVRRGPGYHKCGSRQDLDWVTGLRVLALRGGRWRVLLQRDGLKAGIPGVVDWFKLPRVVTNGVIIELRRSGIDGGWTAWNLVMSAFILEGELLDPVAPRSERLLTAGSISLGGLPAGVRASRRDGEVRYRTKDFEVGFSLGRPGFSYLGLHIEDTANTGKNVLATRPPLFNQGPQLHPLGSAPVLAPGRSSRPSESSRAGPRQTSSPRGATGWTSRLRVSTSCCYSCSNRNVMLREPRSRRPPLISYRVPRSVHAKCQGRESKAEFVIENGEIVDRWKIHTGW